MPQKKKKKIVKQKPLIPKEAKPRPSVKINYSWLERVLNAKLQKKGKEKTIFPFALAQLGIAPSRSEKLIAWQVKRMNFNPAHVEKITKALINVYHAERKLVLEKMR